MSSSLRNQFFREQKRRKENDTQLRDEQRAEELLGQLLPPQRDFVEDPAHHKAALCPRRSGKSFAVLFYACITCLRTRNAKVLVIARVRRQAKGVYWRELKKLSEEYGLSVHFRTMELEAEFSNGSTIQFTGADTAEEIDKFRGQGYDLVCIDEGKSYSPHLLNELIDEIIEPALDDRMGTLVLIGTPGAILAGPFYEITSEDPKRRVQPWADRKGKRKPFYWRLHTWSSKDNTKAPWIWERALQRKEQKGWADDHPTWLREYLGKWIPDDTMLVYAYATIDDDRADFIPHPDTDNRWGLKPGHSWQYILGVDLGYHDQTAFTIAAWSETCPELTYVHCEKHPHLTVEEIAGKARELEALVGRFDARVADTGGLGKTIIESLAKTYGVYFEPARKTDKHDHIKLMNSDLLSGRIKVSPDSPLAEEWRMLQWASEERKKEDKGCANHAADSALYICRYARHHWFKETEPEVAPGTRDWWKQREAEEEERFRQELLAQKNTPWWGKFRKLLDKNVNEERWNWNNWKRYLD